MDRHQRVRPPANGTDQAGASYGPRRDSSKTFMLRSRRTRFLHHEDWKDQLVRICGNQDLFDSLMQLKPEVHMDDILFFNAISAKCRIFDMSIPPGFQQGSEKARVIAESPAKWEMAVRLVEERSGISKISCGRMSYRLRALGRTLWNQPGRYYALPDHRDAGVGTRCQVVSRVEGPEVVSGRRALLELNADARKEESVSSFRPRSHGNHTNLLSRNIAK